MFLDIYRLLWAIYRHRWHWCVLIDEHSMASANYRVRLSSWTFPVPCVLPLAFLLTATTLYNSGKTLKIVSKTVFVEGLIRSARSEVSDLVDCLSNECPSLTFFRYTAPRSTHQLALCISYTFYHCSRKEDNSVEKVK